MKENTPTKLSKILNKKDGNLRFLIIRNGLIGDMVFITPVIERLNNNFPKATIDIVVGHKTKELFISNPIIHNVFLLPKKFSILKHVLFFSSLRKNKYDIVLIQEVNTHYSIMGKISSPKYLIGFENKLSWLHDLSANRSGHAVDAEQNLINLFIPAQKIQTILYTTKKDETTAESILSKNQVDTNSKYICFQVACSEKNSVRQLSNLKLSQLADKIIEQFNVQIIFTGIAEEISQVQEVRKLMKNSSVSIVGQTTLRILISVLKKSMLVIGPDTGTLHMAIAVGTPVLMYMGYSDPKDTGPYDLSNISKTVISDLDCIPCKYKEPKPDRWETCKVNRPTACMEAISVKQLLDNVELILRQLKLVHHQT